MHNIPVLMITHNRLGYTQQALKALVESDCYGIYIFDNGSIDGTKEWLEQYSYRDSFRQNCTSLNSEENIGISGAMNWFLEQTSGFQYCAKVDNDTIIPPDFCAGCYLTWSTPICCRPNTLLSRPPIQMDGMDLRKE
jgi:glycosyltransferase involved in cell wall biosynthesis